MHALTSFQTFDPAPLHCAISCTLHINNVELTLKCSSGSRFCMKTVLPLEPVGERLLQLPPAMEAGWPHKGESLAAGTAPGVPACLPWVQHAVATAAAPAESPSKCCDCHAAAYSLGTPAAVLLLHPSGALQHCLMLRSRVRLLAAPPETPVESQPTIVAGVRPPGQTVAAERPVLRAVLQLRALVVTIAMPPRRCL